jgi:hypothetical protein
MKASGDVHSDAPKADYESPRLERLGTLRDITQSGGQFNPGDGAQPYHRYNSLG